LFKIPSFVTSKKAKYHFRNHRNGILTIKFVILDFPTCVSQRLDGLIISWKIQKTKTGWWFQTFFIFHNIWNNPSH